MVMLEVDVHLLVRFIVRFVRPLGVEARARLAEVVPVGPELTALGLG